MVHSKEDAPTRGGDIGPGYNGLPRFHHSFVRPMGRVLIRTPPSDNNFWI